LRIASWDTPDRNEGNALRAALDRCMTSNLRHHGLMIPELDRNPKGRRPIRKIHMDTGGWVLLSTVKLYVQGEGLENEYQNKVNAARRDGERYKSALVPLSMRGWDIAPIDILQVATSSAKDRYRCMTQVDAYAGFEIPCWLGCNRGRLIKSANPVRIALQLTCLTGFNTLAMVGNVTRKSDDKAMKGIVCNGLRDDYDEKGKPQDRAAIVADPSGATDKCENLYLQRE
jgi:hypothetical protein